MANPSPDPPKAPLWKRLPWRMLIVWWPPVRAWAGGHKSLLLAIAGGLALIVLTPLSAAWLRWRQFQRAEAELNPPVTLDMALAALKKKDFAEARGLAGLLKRKKLPEDERGGPSYVLGACAAREAEDFLGAERARFHLLAVRHLEAAQRHGFPAGREAEGAYLLGRSLALSGRRAESREPLLAALSAGWQPQTELHRLLADAFRSGADADLQTALAHNEQYLADEDLDVDQREEALLRQAQILRRLRDPAGCVAALDRIRPDSLISAEVALLRGRVQFDRARAAKAQSSPVAADEIPPAVREQYQQAIDTLQRAQQDPLSTESVRRAMYLIGLCLLERGDKLEAIAQFERTRRVYLETPEGLAAALQESEMLLELGRDDEALDSLTRVLGAVRAEAPFSNAWIEPEQFRGRVLALYRHWLTASQYTRAVAIAERLAPLFPENRAVELTATVYREWAAHLAGGLNDSVAAGDEQAQAQARSLHRKAGWLYLQLARRNFSARRYTDDLWEAASSFLAGHDFSSAVAAYREYLKYEIRRRRPRALVDLGEALLASNRTDEALAAFRECMEYFGNDAAGYRARLLAAKAHRERDDVASAERLLLQNLGGDLLTPQSREWRESLFALGESLAESGRYDAAIARLEEAIQRYPNTNAATRARYVVGQAYRRAAQVPQEKVRHDTIATARIAHFRQVQQLLGAAIRQFEQVQETLNRRQEMATLTPLEAAILRNSYFFVGTALTDLGRYEDAIRAYTAATSRFQHEPEVLEAFVQIVSCYRRLGRPTEARGAVHQAQVILNRLPEDAPFQVATNYSREQWAEVLTWMAKR